MMGRLLQITRKSIPIVGLRLLLPRTLPAFGEIEMQKDLNQLKMAMGLLGRLALFSFGMAQICGEKQVRLMEYVCICTRARKMV